MTSVTIDRTDGLNSAAAIKGPCRVATTANIVLSGLQTIDGVVLAVGDRVLVKDQTAGSENGIYVADTGPWRRSKDFNKTKDVVKGTLVYVTDGTTNAQTQWAVATENPIAVGTTSIAFTPDPPLAILPRIVADTMLVDNPAGTARENKTFQQVKKLLGTFDTESDFLAASISSVLAVKISGYAAIGDGGEHTKKRIATPSPAKAWHKQSADGAWWEIADATIRPKMLGAKGDARGGSDGGVTAADATFASASGAFTSADIGKAIGIAGAGTAGAVHVTTIASINSATSVELTVAAVTTVSGVAWACGTDDTAALQAAADMGRNVEFDWGDYLITGKITVSTSGQRFFASGYARVSGNDAIAARIYVVNPTLDYVFHCTGTNNTFEGVKIASDLTTTAEAFLFRRPDGSASDIDARLIDVAVEGVTAGATVVGRGLHVKRCEFGNLTRGIALDWPTSWVPNGLDNDTQESGARSYMIEDCLFHGTGTWISNTGANKQNIRSIIAGGNLGDLGGAIFDGVLVDGVIDASIANMGNSSGTVINLHAGSRRSTLIGVRSGGIVEGAVDRTPNNCVNIAFTTANPTYDITILGSFGPCKRNGIQIFGEGSAWGINFIGTSISKAGRTTGNVPAYCPVSIFESGGTFTSVRVSFIGCSVDLTGGDADYIIRGTNSAAVDVTWIGNQIIGADIPIAQSNVHVGLVIADSNPELATYSRKNGTWATDGTEWFGRVEFNTADISGGGVGAAGSLTLRPSTSTGTIAYLRMAVSSSGARDVPALDLFSSALLPVADAAFDVGSTALRMRDVVAQRVRFGDGTRDIVSGAGSPEGVVTAAIGSLYTNTAGGAATTLYVKTSGVGNTGWTAK